MSKANTNHSKLVVSKIRGRSRLISCRTVSPLKAFNPKPLSDFCCVVLSNYGGGFVEGDKINIDVNIERDAKFYLATQANTRIFRSQNGKCSSQSVHGKVSSNGVAIILPDAVVPHTDSRFEQSQYWDLDTGSSLVLAETLHPGRIGIGEKFCYHYFSSKLHIRINRRLVVNDRFVFEPFKHKPSWPGNFGPYQIMTNIFLIGELLQDTIGALKERLRFHATSDTTKVSNYERREPKTTGVLPAFLFSISNLKSFGYVLRILAAEIKEVNQILSMLWDHLTRIAIVDWDPRLRRF